MAVVIEREIVKEDVPRIHSLIEEVTGSPECTEIERLGGLTNHTYHVTVPGGKEYVVRIPGEGTEEVINRSDESISTRLACDLGIDGQLYYFGDDGTKVSEYIPDAITMDEENMRKPENIDMAAAIFRTLHTSGVDTGVIFAVFDMASTYEKFIFDNNVPLYPDYQEKKDQVRTIKDEMDSIFGTDIVPCHNDPLCANWIRSGEKLFLVDWEYAGMNDGMWDIAATSIEACYGPEEDLRFLREYLGSEPTQNDKKHLLASKVFVDYLWTLWAKMRVPFDGQPMEDWALERYTRMAGFIKEYFNFENQEA